MEFKFGDAVLVSDGLTGGIPALVLGIVETESHVKGLKIGAEISTDMDLVPGYVLVAYFHVSDDYPLGFVCCEYPDSLTKED